MVIGPRGARLIFFMYIDDGISLTVRVYRALYRIIKGGIQALGGGGGGFPYPV